MCDGRRRLQGGLRLVSACVKSGADQTRLAFQRCSPSVPTSGHRHQEGDASEIRGVCVISHPCLITHTGGVGCAAGGRVMSSDFCRCLRRKSPTGLRCSASYLGSSWRRSGKPLLSRILQNPASLHWRVSACLTALANERGSALVCRGKSGTVLGGTFLGGRCSTGKGR